MRDPQVKSQHAAAFAKRELDGLRASEKQATQAAAAALEAQQGAEAARSDLKERFQVLMETIETLQAGDAGASVNYFPMPSCCLLFSEGTNL